MSGIFKVRIVVATICLLFGKKSLYQEKTDKEYLYQF